jgi:hypothetical protein
VRTKALSGNRILPICFSAGGASFAGEARKRRRQRQRRWPRGM